QANEPSSGSSKAAIVAVGAPVISGCGGTQLFDISAPSNINWVAVEGPNISNMQLQLFNVDDLGHTSQVNQTAQNVSNSLQAIIDNVVSNNSFANSGAFAASNAATQVANTTAANNSAFTNATTAQSTNVIGQDTTAVSHNDAHTADVLHEAAADH